MAGFCFMGSISDIKKNSVKDPLRGYGVTTYTSVGPYPDTTSDKQGIAGPFSLDLAAVSALREFFELLDKWDHEEGFHGNGNFG